MKVKSFVGLARVASFEKTKETVDISRYVIITEAVEDDGSPIEEDVAIQLSRFKSGEAIAQLEVHSLQALIGKGNVSMRHRGFDPAAEPLLEYLDLYTNSVRKGPLPE